MYFKTNIMKDFTIIEQIYSPFKVKGLKLWDLSSAYDIYKKTHEINYSKKSFDRYINSSGFFPLQNSKILDENNLPLKKAPSDFWNNLIKKNRFLSLKISLHSFKGNNILYIEDNRGKKYWTGISNCSPKYLNKLFIEILEFFNSDVVIWPNGKLTSKLRSLVTYLGTESLPYKNRNLYIPISAYHPYINKKIVINKPINANPMDNSKQNFLSHIERLESESIHIIREVAAESFNPVMLYSVGKDSAVMLHLAKKAFYPAPPPFPLLHVDTGWKFNEMYQFRDLMAKDALMKLIVHINPEGLSKGINPIDHGSEIHTDIMKTQSLKQALDKYGFDFAFGGARRVEEKSRAKERILSFRSESYEWDPKNQRPELWDLYNFRKYQHESARVFPISNWTELDIWQYIYKESIPIVPLYLAAERPVVERNGMIIMIDDDRFKIRKGESVSIKKVRFRTLGCYPLTGAIESEATNISEILLELISTSSTERNGRIIDSDSENSMETKKKEGYF